MPLTKEELQQITQVTQETITEATRAKDAELSELRQKLADAESARAAAERRPAIYGADGSAIPTSGYRSMNKAEKQEYVINRLGNAARGIAASRKSGGAIRAADFIEREYGDKDTAAAVTRALSEGIAGDGGNLVETQYANEMIELLYPMAVVRGMGATVIPMPNGNITIHRLSGGVTGTYEGELNNIHVQQPTTDAVQMAAKKLAVIVPASNELLHDTTGRANRMIVDDMGMGLSLREDLAFLRGDGTNNTPLGLLNQVAPANIVKYTTLAGALAGMRAKLRGANLAMRRVGWVFNSDVEALFYGTLSTTGEYIYRDEMDNGKLLGFNYRVSNQIPSNLTTNGMTSGTELYFGDWAECLIGETLSLNIDTSTEGSYFNGSTLVSAYSTDQTLFRARTRHDFGLRHRQGMVVGQLDLAAVTAR